MNIFEFNKLIFCRIIIFGVGSVGCYVGVRLLFVGVNVIFVGCFCMCEML